jgi:hypothetical protein
MPVTRSGFEVETLIHIRIARAGLRVTEIPSIEYERIHGESKLNAARDGVRALSVIIRERLSSRRRMRRGESAPQYIELPATANGNGFHPPTDVPVATDNRLSHGLLAEPRPGPEIATLDPASAGGPAV